MMSWGISAALFPVQLRPCIAGQIIAEIAQTGRGNVVQLAMSGLVAGMTVGGKAAGKSIAMRCSTNIVFLTARVLGLFSRKKK